MNDLESLASTQLSRRSLLQLIGLAAGATTVLTACQGGGGAASGSGQRIFRAGYPYDAPPKGNFNLLPGVPGAITLGYLYDLVLLPGAMYFWDSQKYFHLLADPSSKLSADGKTLTYKVRPGLKWSDGKPVTAQDVYTTWTLEYLLGNPVFKYVDKITKTDAMTVTFRITSPAPIAEYYLLRGQIVSDAVYGQFMAEAEPMVKALTPNTDQAMVKLTQKVSSFKPKTVTASGPFNFDMDKVGDQQLTLVKNTSGYNADVVNFDTITVANGETEVVTPLILAKKIDYATHGFPVASAQEFGAQGFRIIASSPTYDGDGVFFNFGKHPEFADKRVRQALAYAIDRPQMGQASLGASGVPVKYMAGMSDVLVARWVSPADQAKLNPYPHDLTKAAQLLTQAGWKKQGSQWITPQGSPAAYSLMYASQYANKAAAAQNIQSQLDAFGFKVTLLGDRLDPGPGQHDQRQVRPGHPELGIVAQPVPLRLLRHGHPDVQLSDLEARPGDGLPAGPGHRLRRTDRLRDRDPGQWPGDEPGTEGEGDQTRPRVQRTAAGATGRRPLHQQPGQHREHRRLSARRRPDLQELDLCGQLHHDPDVPGNAQTRRLNDHRR